MKQFDIYAFDGDKERHFVITEVNCESAVITWSKVCKEIFDMHRWSIYFDHRLIRGVYHE